MRSTDGATWTPFCVAPTMADGLNGEYVSSKIGPDDKLQLVFYRKSADTTLGAGVVYWHE